VYFIFSTSLMRKNYQELDITPENLQDSAISHSTDWIARYTIVSETKK
jgi:hypothetical protein